ncbi:hypothetical protein BVRB_6g144640 [Beta vulgaris subsp. vulgaris]|nr:hypothetical protein BVRB_6g144640 [Beta vulgaris subsp. vulgaris]
MKHSLICSSLFSSIFSLFSSSDPPSISSQKPSTAQSVPEIWIILSPLNQRQRE